MPFWSVRTTLSGLGHLGLNRLNIDQAQAATPQDAYDTAYSLWINLTPVFSTAITVVVDPEVETRDTATGEVTAIGVATGEDPFTGAASGEVLPPQNQGLLTLRTGGIAAGRRVHGRIFIPGMTEGQVQDGRISNATLATMQTVATSVLTMAEGDTGGSSVWSKTNGVIYGVSSVEANPYLAVLRRRRGSTVLN